MAATCGTPLIRRPATGNVWWAAPSDPPPRFAAVMTASATRGAGAAGYTAPAGPEGSAMPLHIHAQPGAVAPVVLLPGDPGRSERIAGRLDGAACYNRNRGLLGFTGTTAGIPVSVQTTGMGAPSTAIVAEELGRVW